MCGLVDNAKVDSDKHVRKVTIKYRVPQKCQAIKYKPSVFRYTERNVRGLALLVAAEDKEKTENINVDNLRHSISETSDQEDDPNASDTVDDSNKDNDSNNINTSNKNALKTLIPSSTGRTRFQPKKFIA